MSDEQKKLTDGLLKAIAAERDGYSFYMMAAGSTQDDKARDVFETLAGEELEHMNFLRQQYDSVMKTGRPDSSAMLGTRKHFEGVSPIFSENIKTRIKDAHIEMSALSIGVQLELDAIKFYNDRAEETSYPDVKKFYKELAEWETGHYNLLSEQQKQLKEDYWSEGGFAPF